MSCKVKNRSGSVVVYNIPADGNLPSVTRRFVPGEVKDIDVMELERLTHQAGGMNILTRFLQVQDDRAIKSFNMRVEPEYFMEEADVAKLIKSGSLDAFLDALDFAPDGVIDLIKRMSVSLPLLDMAKRDALKAKTGFDVEAAIKNLRADKEDDEKKDNILDDEAPKRRVATGTGRRTAAPKYNVVTPKEETKTE